MMPAVQISMTRTGPDEFKVLAQSHRTILRSSVLTRSDALGLLARELDALEICPAAWSPECLRTTEI